MDQVYVLRHKVLVEGLSVRAVARQLGISRNTARRYLEGAAPRVRAPTERPKPVVDRIRPRLEALLTEAPRWTGGKQRLTAARLHRLLLEQGQQVSETVVKDIVREWRRQRQEVFVPLVYRPGDLGEVDFFEVLVDLAGQRRKAWMFLVRLMHSGRDFAWLYPRQDQICFLDGHVRAFAHFGAVPQRLVYDNLKPAVTRVLVGSERELSLRFTAMATHYVFEPCFARPGTGHDKGGVESRGRAIRWQHLVPIPNGTSLDAISRDLVAGLDARAGRQRDAEGRTIAERFEDERGRMLPLPERPFRAAAVRLASVSRRALAKVEGAVYSVPCRWAGLDVTAYVGVDQVALEGPSGRVQHPRARFGGRSIDYRHYVPELAHKPQAVRQVAEELMRDLGEPFGRVWRRLVDQHGPKHAARVFAQVLRCLEQLGHACVVDRLERALQNDEPLLLALQPTVPISEVPMIVLPSSLQDVEVLAGRAADYDALLGGAS
jgi:transposase